MQITYKYEEKEIKRTFNDVPCGSLFLKDGKLYRKITEIKNQTYQTNCITHDLRFYWMELHESIDKFMLDNFVKAEYTFI